MFMLLFFNKKILKTFLNVFKFFKFYLLTLMKTFLKFLCKFYINFLKYLLNKFLLNVPIQRKHYFTETVEKISKNFEKIYREFAQKFKKFFKIVLEIKFKNIK